jgi:threonine dehydrogenase-like Zn-dependent dehydrogenase
MAAENCQIKPGDTVAVWGCGPVVSSRSNMPILLERIERGEIDPSVIITHRIGLEEAPAMYRTFRDKEDACVKVVMKPGATMSHHTEPPASRQQ